MTPNPAAGTSRKMAVFLISLPAPPSPPGPWLKPFRIRWFTSVKTDRRFWKASEPGLPMGGAIPSGNSPQRSNADMSTKSSREIIRDGLWTNNPALVQVLGLCPFLAVTSTVVNALGLGIATMLVLMGSNLAVSLIRNFVSESVRLPAFVMIIASFVTCAELLMQAFTYELYQILGIFIPLIVTNCAILGRADAFASKRSEEHTSELQSRPHLVCRLLLEKKNKPNTQHL